MLVIMLVLIWSLMLLIGFGWFPPLLAIIAKMPIISTIVTLEILLVEILI
jgi:hypothetical protein